VRPRIGGRRLQDRAPHSFARRRDERTSQRQQFVQDHAQRPDVDAPIERPLAAHEFRRHVRRCADRAADRRQYVGLLLSRQAEVHDYGRALLGQQDVARLHVTMDEPRRVRGMQRTGAGLDPFDGGPPVLQQGVAFGCRQRAQCLQVLRQRLTLHVPHRDEVDTVGGTDFVDRAEIRMVEPGDDRRLAQECAAGIIAVERVKRLQRDVTFEIRIEREVDFALSSATEQLLQSIPTDEDAAVGGGVERARRGVIQRQPFELRRDRVRMPREQRAVLVERSDAIELEVREEDLGEHPYCGLLIHGGFPAGRFAFTAHRSRTAHAIDFARAPVAGVPLRD
jgi:hypothetical protein